MGSRSFQRCVNVAATVVVLLAFFYETCDGQQRRARVSSSGQQPVEFDCPEEFGYYPHPSDCTQYYVCVFGGALLESCTGGLMYSHELQTCDWPRNVGCGAEGESATISTVRVTDPRTKQTTPTGLPSRTVPVSRGQQQQQQQLQQREQQQRQQQEEIAKHQLYADDLGPAEEVESDRQQRVYRGQPSTVGQVARDRDGLRHQVTNAIPAPPGRVPSGDKISVISFGTQHQQQQYSFDELTLDNNFLLTNETHHRRREKRQARYRFPGQGGPVLQLGRPGLNTFSSLTVPVLANGGNYNNYQTFGPANNNAVPLAVPPPVPRPSNPAPPPSSDNDYRPILNTNIPNSDITHFRSPENYHNSGQRPPPNLQFTQTNNNFKPRLSQTPNPTGSAYNFQQYVNQPPVSPNIDLRSQQPLVPFGIESQQQQASTPSNTNLQQHNPLLQNINQNVQYPNPTFPIAELSPASPLTRFHHTSEVFSSPSVSPTFLSSTGHQQVGLQSTVRVPSTPGIIYRNQKPQQEENYSYLLFERPNPTSNAVQFSPTSTEHPTSLHSSAFPNYVTTLRTLPNGQNSLGFPHDTLSFDEVHKHEQRETGDHLVPPPPPLRQPQISQYSNQKQQQIQQTWQKLLRDQQQQQQQKQQSQQEDWSPLPHSTERLPSAQSLNNRQPALFQNHKQSQSYENQGSKPQQSQTESPFKPNANPYGDTYIDNGKYVDVVYKNNNRDVSQIPNLNPDLYKRPTSTSEPGEHQKNQQASDEYKSSPVDALTRQQPNLSSGNPAEKQHRNRIPVLYPPSNTQNPFSAENHAKRNRETYEGQSYAPSPDTHKASIPYEKYENVKFPAQANNEKHQFTKPLANDYSGDVYNDDAEYYDDYELEEERHGFERPEVGNISSQNYNRGNTKYEDNEKESATHNIETLPQNQSRQPQKQALSEQNYQERHKLPEGEPPSLSTKLNSGNTESHDDKSSSSGNDDQIRNDATKDRFPSPPPEFYEELTKYKHIENPFADIDFDFDAYLDKLRGNPTSTDHPKSKEQEIKDKEPPEANYYGNEGEHVKSTTSQNLVPANDEATTTWKPSIRQRPRPAQPIHIKNTRGRPSQIQTTEYIKEYYPAQRPENVYNPEDIVTHDKESKKQTNLEQENPKNTNIDILQDSRLKKDHASSTTHGPLPNGATIHHVNPVNPNPLTVPFYSGEDGNFYANPIHNQHHRPRIKQHGVTNDASQPPVESYYKYSVDDVKSDVSSFLQTTQRNPHILSTSEPHSQSHTNHYKKSKDGVGNVGSYQSVVTTPGQYVSTNTNTLHPIVEAVTFPTRGKHARRGPVRTKSENVGRFPNISQYNSHISQTTETNIASDNSGKNSYYGENIYPQTGPARQKIKIPQTFLPAKQPHPFTTTVSSSGEYKYQTLSTEITPPKPVADIVLAPNDSKSKKTGQTILQSSVEENDTIKPVRDFKNVRIPENSKIVPNAYTSTVPSAETTELLFTSTTQFNGWDTWPGTTPYSKQVSDIELTTPTQNKYTATEASTRSRFNSQLQLTTPTLVEYTTVNVVDEPDTHSTTTPVTYLDVQTSTRPASELLDSVYDIAKTMFDPQYDSNQAGKNIYFESSSENSSQNPFTETVLESNTTTTTIPKTTRTKIRRRRPINKTVRLTSDLSHTGEYTTSAIYLNDPTTPESFTLSYRPSKDHLITPMRYRLRRPNTILSSTNANAIITTSLPSNDIDSTFSTTVKSLLPTRSRHPVTPRRFRRPTKTRVDMTSTEAYADNDKSESYERPLQDNVNRLNRKPLPEKESSTTTIAALRVEPSVPPVTFVQQPAVQPPAVYNNSQRYNTAQYDPYYNLYDEDVELYRDVADYSQFPSGRQTSTSTNNQQPSYRGQSPYKQPPQAPPQEPQRNAAYIQPTYNSQQDVYIDPQEYNENYNTATDDQIQYNQQAGSRQPVKSQNRGNRNELKFALQSSSTTSTTIPPTTTIITTTTIRSTTAPPTITTTIVPTRQQTRPRVEPTTNTNINKYNAVLAAISTSSPNDLASAVHTSTTRFPQIPDFETPYLLTLQDSKPEPTSRQPVHTNPEQTNSQTPKSRRVTLSAGFSLDDPFSTSSRASQSSRSRGSAQRVSIQPASGNGRRTSEVSAPLSEVPRSSGQNSFPSRSQDSNTRRVATKSFTVIDDTNSSSQSFSLDAEISALEDSLKQNSGKRNGEERRRGSSRNDQSTTRSQNQRGSAESVQRTRLTLESTTAASQTIFRESPSSVNSGKSSQPQQPEQPNPQTTLDVVTSRPSSRIINTELVSSPSIRVPSSSRGRETQKEPGLTTSPSALRSSYRASLIEADDIQSGLSHNSIVQQSDVSTSNRARSRGSSQRKTSCDDAVDTNSDTGCDEKPQIRVRPTTASPDSQSTPVPARGNNAGRVRGGGAAYTTASGAEPVVNRGTPASVSRSRPTLKPSTAIVSKAQEFVDIYRYPPRRPDPVYPTPQVDKTAAKCRKDVCLLPDCYCGGKDIPGDLPAEEVPQIVLLTFDDAINDLNKGLYQDIFEKGRTNPNGCPITATFYVSHEWTDYSQAQNLYADGHEMASHSISHSFGEQFSQKKWTREIAGQREILAAYGGVRLEDVRGMRAPFLAIGGNKMFKMLYDSNFTYDSSMPVYENRPPSWPYTLDYKIFHDCMIPPCPTRSYPGVWEVPMVMWQDLNGGRCSMGDACSNPPTADGVYKMLIKNFERHYTTNRAPFGLYYHAAWFTQPHHKEGFIAFLDTIVNMQDVWLVTNWQALQWVRDPTPLSRVNSFPPFQCNYPERPRRCNNPKVCNLWHKSGVRYMRTCQPCPDVYPWTGKTGVRNSRVDNEIAEE